MAAAEDVAPLLDDAQLAVRQEAALVLYRLHDAGTVPALRRALARDEDPTVRKLAALGVARAAPVSRRRRWWTRSFMMPTWPSGGAPR